MAPPNETQENSTTPTPDAMEMAISAASMAWLPPARRSPARESRIAFVKAKPGRNIIREPTIMASVLYARPVALNNSAIKAISAHTVKLRIKEIKRYLSANARKRGNGPDCQGTAEFSKSCAQHQSEKKPQGRLPAPEEEGVLCFSGNLFQPFICFADRTWISHKFPGKIIDHGDSVQIDGNPLNALNYGIRLPIAS